MKEIILEPSHITNKRRNANMTLETFETMKNKKVAHYFTSATDRKLPDNPGINSEFLGPASYDHDRSKDILKRRKDFALKVP